MRLGWLKYERCLHLFAVLIELLGHAGLANTLVLAHVHEHLYARIDHLRFNHETRPGRNLSTL